MRYTRHKRMINGDAGVKNGIFILAREKIWWSNGIHEKRKKDPYNIRQERRLVILEWLVPSCFAIFTFEPLTLSLTSMPSCDLESLTNILILCLILKASNQSLRKSLSLNLELS
ncbi:hypothetical protein Tco_1036544 [Tanacetum coccineum]